MKKIFLVLVLLIFAQTGFCSNAPLSTYSIVNDLKDAIKKDVTNTVNATVNSVKLASCKAQLEQKKKELEDLDKSTSSSFVKYYKKIRLKQQIADLERDIRELEDQM